MPHLMSPDATFPEQNLGLGLVPPTPPVHFDAADTPISQRFTSLHETLQKSPDTGTVLVDMGSWPVIHIRNSADVTGSFIKLIVDMTFLL